MKSGRFGKKDIAAGLLYYSFPKRSTSVGISSMMLTDRLIIWACQWQNNHFQESYFDSQRIKAIAACFAAPVWDNLLDWLQNLCIY